jgi:hypothetical protein
MPPTGGWESCATAVIQMRQRESNRLEVLLRAQFGGYVSDACALMVMSAE